MCAISSGVLTYCEYYMEGEKHYMRFIYVLVMFVGSMLLLVVRPNLVSILLG